MSGAPPVVVRRATLADYPAIEAFIREAYGDLAPYKGWERWRWQFVDNPFLAPGEPPPVWIAVDGERVAGQIAVQRCGLTAGGRIYAAGWIVDVMILPSHRGLKLGHRLYEAAADSGLALITLTMAEATRRMAEKLGSIELPPIREQFRPETPLGPDIARYVALRTANRPNWRRAADALGTIGAPHAAAFALRIGAGVRDRLRPVAVEEGFVFAPVDRFDAGVDALWASIAGRVAGVPRTAQHLNWRFADCPQLRYERFAVVRGGETVGYLILRAPAAGELHHAIVVDALARDDDAAVWRNLVAYACRRFAGNVAALEAACSAPAAIRALAATGFIPGKVHRPTVVCRDRRVLDELAAAKDWFLNRGDHDWDQIHLA